MEKLFFYFCIHHRMTSISLRYEHRTMQKVLRKILCFETETITCHLLLQNCNSSAADSWESCLIMHASLGSLRPAGPDLFIRISLHKSDPAPYKCQLSSSSPDQINNILFGIQYTRNN